MRREVNEYSRELGSLHTSARGDGSNATLLRVHALYQLTHKNPSRADWGGASTSNRSK